MSPQECSPEGGKDLGGCCVSHLLCPSWSMAPVITCPSFVVAAPWLIKDCYRGFQVLQRSSENQVPDCSWSWVQLDSVTPLDNYGNYCLGHFHLNSLFPRMLVCSLEGLFPQDRCQATSMENLKDLRNLWEVKNNMKFFQSVIQNASVALCLDSSPSSIE